MGREETPPGRTEAGTGSEIDTGTLERVKQRWASAGGECPAPPCGKGHGYPEASSEGGSPPIYLSYLGTKFLRSELSLTSPTISSQLFFFGDLPSFLPAAGTGSSRAPGLQKRFHQVRGCADCWGWRPPRTMRAPWSAVRNSSNPSCWNARRRRLLHSGPNVFVITP